MNEGDDCPVCGKGTMEWPETVDCACHISPPCSRCTDKELTCNNCGYEDGD